MRGRSAAVGALLLLSSAGCGLVLDPSFPRDVPDVPDAVTDAATDVATDVATDAPDAPEAGPPLDAPDVPDAPDVR
jgi:hypothetical protein